MKQNPIRLAVGLGVLIGSVLSAGPGHATVTHQMPGHIAKPAGPSHISAKPIPSPFPTPAKP